MALESERAAKRVKLLSDDELDDGSSDSSGGVALGGMSPQPELKINMEYARRFDHNSQRAELHRLEEKYGRKSTDTKVPKDADGDGESSDSSTTSTDEDDDGILASGMLEDEFNATLKAIRSKDPRLYDAKATFFTAADRDESSENPQAKKEKPMYLQDYHRENILRGNADTEDVEPEPTYTQQQEQLKSEIVKEMLDAAVEADDEEDFLVAKEKPTRLESRHRGNVTITATEVENADADPDAFLSKFLDSRAWVHAPGSAVHPFESDDEEEDERAEAIEEAYNFRFEDPSKANEKLVSHARDAVAKYSVRKEAPSKRQRAREAEKQRKVTEKQERKLEKARLRKLRVEEAQGKLEQIKDAAGAKATELKLDEWQDLLTGDWDEDQWEAEMQKRFNEAYYAQASESDREEEGAIRKKTKRPKWKDDVDITDLVPEFDGGEDAKFSLSSDESQHEEEAMEPAPQKKKKKDKLAAKAEKKKDRKRVEQLVDAQLDLEIALNGRGSVRKGPGFRYRETSPLAFGMTAKDILLADDNQLNQFAGLKKLAAFRDPEKKRRDKKQLGKKARLREWRKETFGSGRGPMQSLQDTIREQLAAGAHGDKEHESRMPPGKKRKRSKVSMEE